MKTNLSALEILDRIVQKVFFLDKWRRPGKPGELINALPQAERDELVKLTSEEAQEMQTPHPAYWCENHYHQQKADQELSEEKKKFDAKMKFWMM